MKNLIYKIILGVSIITFIVIFSFLAIRRYKTLNSYYYDLGIMNQVAYNTSQGRFLEMTNQDYKKNMNRLAIHFDPILVAFVPFYKIYSGPEVLLIGQTIIVALGALAIFLISKVILGESIVGLVFALSYLFYFPIQRVVIFDFHAVALGTTFLLFAFYFNLIKKYRLYFIFILLALLTKEQIGLNIFFLGIYLYFIKKQKKVGIITSILGLVFFVSTVYFIIPYFRGGEHFAAKYFDNIYDRLGQIIQDGIPYSTKLILPAFYSIFSPLTLLVSLPEWAINIASNNQNLRSIYFHYNSVLVAFIYYSLILGYKNFTKIFKNKNFQRLFFLIFIFFNFYSAYKYNPVPNFVKQPVRYRNLDLTMVKSIKIWQEKLKDEKIVVATTPKLAPFFTNRKVYFNFLYDSAYSEMGILEEDILKDDIHKYVLADYVIINRSEIGDIGKGTLPVKFYQDLRENEDFEMIYSDNRDVKSIEVYKKL